MGTLPPDSSGEVARVTALFQNKPTELLTWLSGQLTVLKNEAQMLLGLCGLTITVTGFSGTHMIRAGRLSAFLMVVGMGVTLIAAVLALGTATEVRWVSQDLSDDLEQTVRSVFERRNRSQQRLRWAGRMVAAGLAAYMASVATAAWLSIGGNAP